MTWCFKKKTVFNEQERTILLSAVLHQNFNEIGQLLKDYELPKAQKALVDNFFQNEGSVDGYNYQRMPQLILTKEDSLFDEYGGLKEWVLQASGHESFAHLNDVLWKMLQESFKSVFDSEGNIKPWLRKGLGEPSFRQLESSFSANKLKFKFLQEYLHVFCAYCPQREKEGELACASIMIALLKHELAHLKKVVEALTFIERYLRSMDGKASRFKRQLTELHRLAHCLFFSGKVRSHDNFYQIVLNTSELLRSPLNQQALLCLREATVKNQDKTPINHFKLLKGVALSLSFSALMLCALLSIPGGVAPALLFIEAMIGLGGLFWGLFTIEKGTGQRFCEQVADFIDEIKKVQKGLPPLEVGCQANNVRGGLGRYSL